MCVLGEIEKKMSGAGKKVADVAFKASRTIDWEGMAKVLVTDEARREFSNLRRAFDEVNTQLQTKFSQVLSQFTLFLLIDLYVSPNHLIPFACGLDLES